MVNKFNDFEYFSKSNDEMRHLFFLFLFLNLFVNKGFTAISPYYKEVIQRGYIINGDSVEFPDGSGCLIVDFNNGKCGEKWKNEDYCIAEGGMVWDEDKCCEGLEPYLAPGINGQAVCKRKNGSGNLFLILSISIAVLLALFFIVRNKAKKTKRKIRTNSEYYK